jgi:RNA polymerase sigma-70 factor, ECF subfamily
MTAEHKAVDLTVAQLCEQGRFEQASASALQAHGGEIMRFPVSRARSPQLASEAFSTFSEDLCRGLPSFRFRCSLRTWLYTLARNALFRTRRALAAERARTTPIPDSEERPLPAPGERSETPAYLRTEVKQYMRRLRERLPESDQMLLDLRTTRRFSWKDIARILLDDGAADDDAVLDREAARQRKRFQLVTERLRAMALAEGVLLESAD